MLLLTCSGVLDEMTVDVGDIVVVCLHLDSCTYPDAVQVSVLLQRPTRHD